MTLHYYQNNEDISGEIKKINIIIDEKIIAYDMFLKTLSFNTDVLKNINTKIELVNTEIKAYTTALNYNYLDHNYTNMSSLLEDANKNLEVLNKIKEDQKITINTYENHVNNAASQIQILNTYLEDLNKMRDRIDRWGNIEYISESQKRSDAYENKILFNSQLDIINSYVK